MLLGDQNTCHALPGPPWIVHKGRFHVCHFLVAFTGYEMMRGFLKGVSEDVLYLQINDVLEYNLPYVQSDFMCNLGPTKILTQHLHCKIPFMFYCWGNPVVHLPT